MRGRLVRSGVGGAVGASGVVGTQRRAVAHIAAERSAEHGAAHSGWPRLLRLSPSGLASARRTRRALIRLLAARRAAAASGGHLLRGIINSWQANPLLQQTGRRLRLLPRGTTARGRQLSSVVVRRASVT